MAWMRGEDEISAPGPDGKVVALHQRGVSIPRRASRQVSMQAPFTNAGNCYAPGHATVCL